MPKLFSVIIPTYNRGDVVGEAIRSVLDQSFTDYEVVIVDDGSSDDTASAVASLLDDGRVQCDVCPHFCKLKEGKQGLCFVRANHNDQIALTTYGRSSGFCIDPIEKKPLNLSLIHI